MPDWEEEVDKSSESKVLGLHVFLHVSSSVSSCAVSCVTSESKVMVDLHAFLLVSIMCFIREQDVMS